MKVKRRYNRPTTTVFAPHHAPASAHVWERYLARHGFSVRELGDALGVSPAAISLFLNGKRTLTIDFALRLGRFLDVDPEELLLLEARHLLEERETALQDELDRIPPVSVLKAAHLARRGGT